MISYDGYQLFPDHILKSISLQSKVNSLVWYSLHVAHGLDSLSAQSQTIANVVNTVANPDPYSSSSIFRTKIYYFKTISVVSVIVCSNHSDDLVDAVNSSLLSLMRPDRSS